MEGEHRKEEILIGGWLDGETEDKEEKMKCDKGKYNKNEDSSVWALLRMRE